MSAAQSTLLALLAAVAWGGGNVAQKTVLDHLDPMAAAGITSLIGAAVLLPILRHEARRPRIEARGGWPLLIFVAVLFTLATTLLQFGYGLTTVTNGGFLVNTAAILTPIIGWAVLRQRPPAACWPAGLLALLGVFLLAGGQWSGLSSGDLLALLSGLVFAVWTLALGVHVMRHRRPVLATVTQLLVSGVLCLSAAAALGRLPGRADLVAALPEILFMGLMAKGIAYVLMAMAQQHLSATVVGILVSAEAVFGAALAAILLGESLTVTQAVGAVCILSGVVIAARIPDQTAPRAPRPAASGP